MKDKKGYSLSEITDEMKRIRKDYNEQFKKIRRSGALFLMPDKIENEIMECARSFVAAEKASEYRAVIDQVEAIFTDIKKVLGLTIFE